MLQNVHRFFKSFILNYHEIHMYRLATEKIENPLIIFPNKIIKNLKNYFCLISLISMATLYICIDTYTARSNYHR